MKHFQFLLVFCVLFRGSAGILSATVVSTNYGISYQVNVSASGQNIPGDAANEPSLCIDPTNPNRIAVGWRQFDTTNSDFRQSGVAYSTNGGLNWTFPGNLDAGTFRSDPVLAADADGIFYYLGITNEDTFACDLLRSTDGGPIGSRSDPPWEATRSGWRSTRRAARAAAISIKYGVRFTTSIIIKTRSSRVQPMAGTVG